MMIITYRMRNKGKTWVGNWVEFSGRFKDWNAFSLFIGVEASYNREVEPGTAHVSSMF